MEDPTNQDRSYLRNLIRARLGSYSESTVADPSEAASAGEKRSQHFGSDSKQCIQNDQQGLDNETSLPGQHAELLQLDFTAEAGRPAGHYENDSLEGRLCADLECGNGEGDIVRDVLLLSRVCSTAKQRMQKDVDLLLDQVTQPSAGLCNDNVSCPILDTQPSHQMSFMGIEQDLKRQPTIQSIGDLGRLHLAHGKIDLKPFQGQKRSVIVRVLAQLLQVIVQTSIRFHPDAHWSHQCKKTIGQANCRVHVNGLLLRSLCSWASDERFNMK